MSSQLALPSLFGLPLFEAAPRTEPVARAEHGKARPARAARTTPPRPELYGMAAAIHALYQDGLGSNGDEG